MVKGTILLSPEFSLVQLPLPKSRTDFSGGFEAEWGNSVPDSRYSTYPCIFLYQLYDKGRRIHPISHNIQYTERYNRYSSICELS